ncbi:MAG: monovalent cation/H(+) antiporter subunit G [Gemmatimonadota bacterium]|nr:monovalent cation/H(+) antiporter subunit G [Gemmatimonadota bacterium]
MAIVDILSWICLISGCILCMIGGLGLLRLPDFYSRMHGGGITDTLGAGLVLIGLMFQGGLTTVTVKLVMILVILLITSPTSTHAVGKAALTSGLKPFVDDPDNKGKNEHD